MKTNYLFYILISVVLAGCSTQYSAVYQSVDVKDKWDESTWIFDQSETEQPLYRVEDGVLYLKIKAKRKDWMFRTIIEYPPWNKSDMNKFLEQHAALRKLMPLDWNDWLPAGYGDECKPGQRASRPVSG